MRRGLRPTIRNVVDLANALVGKTSPMKRELKRSHRVIFVVIGDVAGASPTKRGLKPRSRAPEKVDVRGCGSIPDEEGTERRQCCLESWA